MQMQKKSKAFALLINTRSIRFHVTGGCVARAWIHPPKTLTA